MFRAKRFEDFKFIKAGESEFWSIFLLLVAMVVAFAVSMVAIRFLTSYVKTRPYNVWKIPYCPR